MLIDAICITGSQWGRPSSKLIAHPQALECRGLIWTRCLEFSISLPSLPEQQRIVAILDEAFAGLATATANAERNLKNARELFDSVSNSLLKARNEKWQRLSLETLLERGWIVSHLDGNHGNDYPRREEFISSGVPYLSANCLESDSVNMSLAKYSVTTSSGVTTKRRGPKRRCPVCSQRDGRTSRDAVYRRAKSYSSTSLTYYRCNLDHIVPEYLAHYMRSPEFKTQYEVVMRQSTRNQVPITKQREFFHIIPPLDEQRRIAEKLDMLLSEVKRLDAVYSQRLRYVSELKQSILQKSFSGELTSSQAINEAAE